MKTWFCFAFVFSVVAVGLSTRDLRASDDLRRELSDLAIAIKKTLAAKQEDSVAIGQFTGPPNFPTSGGPGLVQILTEELQKLGITVKTRAKLGLKGEYRVSELPSADKDDARLGVKVLALRIRASIEEINGDILKDFLFDRKIRGEAAVASLIGLTVSLDPKGTEKDRDQELRGQITDPKKPHIERSVIRSRDKSPYAVEIMVNTHPRAATEKDGLAFVSIKRGEVYAVRLVNNSDIETAVQLRIDGLNMFAFSELRHKDGAKKGEPLYTAVILAPKSSVIIAGWHRTNDKSDSFKVTAYADSAAATLKHTANLGTITATFQASWPQGGQAPADEPGKRRGGTGDATGFGPRIDMKYQEVKRNFGVIRDVVSVRYTK